MSTRGERRGVAAVVLVLALVMLGTAHAETVEERLDRMEREIQSLKEELRRERARKTAPAAPETPVAPVAAPAVPAAPAAPPQQVAAPAAERGPAAEAIAAITERVRLGGYGSTRFEASTLEDQNNTFTFRRFVLTADADIAPRLRSYMELEFERFRELELEKQAGPEDGGLAVEQTVEGTNESEIAFEQAWLDFELLDWAHLRVGEVLVPVGRFNLNHDDNRWDIPRRPLVDRGTPVLPVTAAWGELGAGFTGALPVGSEGRLGYEAYVVNGTSLDVEFEQIARTRRGEPAQQVIEAKIEPSTGPFGSDVKDAKAVTGRLVYSPALQHEIAASGYYGQYTPDYLGNEDLFSVALDGLTGLGPFELEGEYVYTQFDGISTVARNLARVAIDQSAEAENEGLESEVEFELANLARSKQGFWLEGRYRFWPSLLDGSILGRRFDDPQLVAVVRGEGVWLNDLVEEVGFSGGRLTDFETDDRRVGRVTGGLAYRPVPQVAFQLAYEFTWTDSGQSLAGVTNYLPARADEDHVHTLLVGAAFGF